MFLTGPTKQCKRMMDSGRIIATCVYLGSIVATLVVAFKVGNRRTGFSVPDHTVPCFDMVLRHMDSGGTELLEGVPRIELTTINLLRVAKVIVSASWDIASFVWGHLVVDRCNRQLNMLLFLSIKIRVLVDCLCEVLT